MKKIITVLGLSTLLLSLAACNGITNCKMDGCNKDIYKDGYCQYHYTVGAVKAGVDEVGQGLFDNIFGE